MDIFRNALLPTASVGFQFIDPVHPHIFLTDGTEISRGVQAIIQEFSLNDDQAFAFQIIVDQTIGRSKVGSQLRMGIFGEGGTGKSRLIDTIRAWFKFCRREEELIVTATTGAAASKINGTTVHSATGISFSKKKRRGDGEDVHVTNKMKDWSDRNYMIVDEMSMMDTDVIASASTKLGHAKSLPSEKFGGVNVIFMGDFLQLASVSSRDLYIDNAKTRTGHDIWRSLNASVILRHQIRQAGDPRYAQLLHRLRFHKPTDEDIDLLNTRVGVPIPSHLDLPVIVRRHNLRHAINIEKIHQVSQETGVPIIYCVANVLKREGGISMDAALAARYSASGSVVGDAILPILPGTPLMLTQNSNIPLGIFPIVIFTDLFTGLVNGAIVKFYGFPKQACTRDNIITTPEYILVEIIEGPGKNIQISGLPPGVVALDPVKFWYNAGHGRRAYLEQFALTLAYARTDYKAQGQTMSYGAVLDIQRPARGPSASASPYVQLSRVPSLDMVFILRPFDLAELRRPLSDELLAELAWEEEMAEKTKRLYGM